MDPCCVSVRPVRHGISSVLWLYSPLLAQGRVTSRSPDTRIHWTLRDSWRPWASIVHSRTKWPAASIPIHWHSNASNYSYWHTSDGPCWFEQVTGRPHVNLTTSLSGLIRSTNRVFRSLRIAHLCIPLLDIMAREDPLAQSKNDIVIAYVEIFCDKYA